MSARVLVAADVADAGYFADLALDLGAPALSLARFTNPRAAWLRALEETRPQVVLAEHWRTAAPDLLLALRECSTPYAVFLLEPPASHFLLRPRSRAWRTALAGAEALVAPTAFVREAWIARGAPPERFALIPALPLSAPSPLGLRRQPRTLLLDASHGCASGLELIGEPLTLHVIGGMPRRTPRQHTFRPLAGSDAEALASCSAVLVLPTRDVGYCHWVAVAQASGLPAVAIARGGVAEQIIHGVSGFLAAPGDPPGVGEAIAEALGVQTFPRHQHDAEAALAKTLALVRALTDGRHREAGLAIEFRDWLEQHPDGEAELIASLRDNHVGEPSLRARVRAITRQRRLDLNHAIAFLRACNCSRVAFGPMSGAPDAVERLRAWDLDPSPTAAMADAIVWEADEGPDLGVLRRQFPGARALVALTPDGVETLELG
ncbi:MAG TPA: glycosyltransferase [Terriglobales bacterium]|nr:glycosyltransferase [Terriglobales bacterium]